MTDFRYFAFRFVPLCVVALLVSANGCSTSVSNTASPSPTATRTTAPTDPDSRRKQAEQFIASKELYAAVPQLSIVIAQDGNKEADMLRLAELYLRLGETEEADTLLTKAIAAKASPNLRFALAQTRTQNNDFAGAADALLPLIPQWDALPMQNRPLLTRTLLLAGRTAEVAPLLPNATTDAEWLAQKGLLEIVRNRPAAALPILEKAVMGNPDDAFAAFLLGVAAERSGKLTAARDAYARSASSPDPPTDAAFGLARVLVQLGESDPAMALLNKLPADARNHPDFWRITDTVERERGNKISAEISRGYAFFYNGDPWQAESLWKSALPNATGEDRKELYTLLHNSAYRRQEPQDALKFAFEGVKAFPQDTYLLKRKAEVLLSQNRLDEAQVTAKLLQTRTADNPTWEIADLLCRLAVDDGKPEQLTRASQQYEQLQPTSPFPYLYRAEWQEQKGRSPENLRRTLELYQKAAERDPKNADAFAHIGLLQAELKESDKAETALLHALTLWPRVMEGTPHATLTQIYQRQGRSAEAAFHAEQYQKLRRRKERWPSLMKYLRQSSDREVELFRPRPTPPSASDWKELGTAALERRETWVALCAFRQATRGKGTTDPDVRNGLAAAAKRNGWFLMALDIMAGRETAK